MTRLPSLFVSHGAPTFALQPGAVGKKLARLGRALPSLEAVVVVSPHWMTESPRVTSSARPGTIHDFRGFDDALYALRYPAPGAPALARRVVSLLREAGWSADADPGRGLDHGAWVPLMHLLPAARTPVIQVSLPGGLDAHGAFALGEALEPLSGEGVLMVGSGSLTHNLYEVFRGTRETAYAHAFVDWIRDAVAAGDTRRLLDALNDAPHAQRAHPTPEHYWPLLVAAGAGRYDGTQLIDGGMTYGVLSMDAFLFGPSIATGE